MNENIWNDENLIKVLNENDVVVMPTDTIYGIVGKAFNKDVVERIYKIRERSPDKPCIILIGNIDELNKFSVVLSKKQKEITKEYWPGPVSVILDCPDDSFKYLHRGTKTLAFRLPLSEFLQNLLLKTGPLLAPSANKEGITPALNIKEAKKYFGNSIDLYIDGGELKGEASKLIKLNNGNSIIVLRE
ncbi:MAG: L-threonylcarbamoyladenylate synthase [Candidatus Paceibacterota bacterium]|jgi:L-threonylcarbamoyladenylate synthase